MGASKRRPGPPGRYRIKAPDLRWRCDPARFDFRTTADIRECPIQIIGQERALEALRLGLGIRSDGYNIFVSGEVGGGRSTVVRRVLGELDRKDVRPPDLVFVHNFEDPDQPRKMAFPAGQGRKFREWLTELIEAIVEEIGKLFDSEEYGKHRASVFEAAAKKQKGMLRDFEARVHEQGFALVHVEMGPITRPQLVPVVAGNPVEMDQLESLVQQEKFAQADYDQLQAALPDLRGEMEALGRLMRNLDREVRRDLAEGDRGLARPLVEEGLQELRQGFEADGLEECLRAIAEDLVEHLDDFRDAAGPTVEPESGGERGSPYAVNVVVDNSHVGGRPVIWETAPTYRNLFGTVERKRLANGEWTTDHTRIKAGSLLRANAGYLVVDAMDLLSEPGVWAGLKRTLRTGRLEIQTFDPLHVLSSASLKPEAVPIDVKVILIGTPQIYQLLYSHDEDFKKIFKVKADFAQFTPLSDEELQNFACFVYKKVGDDDLPHFQREAVAAVVEHGVRLAGHRERLTTRFTQIADLIRESGYWASRARSRFVKAEHVLRALAERDRRYNLFEELVRERIAQGMVLVDLEGEKVGQVNGLAVLDQGDHSFGVPSRITASTAMGRAGIIDLDREAAMAGSIHTKGVLILTGFLRSTFAQNKPLTLSASLSFEQNYGGVDGDSASSAELYALLSSLADVPIRQGIAVTGSVNQKGEIQPIGGVNEKIEGYFRVCRLLGLSGQQGVLIPTRNLPNLMLGKEVLAEVRKNRFHVWAVSTIAEGLEVLTGLQAGRRDDAGAFGENTVFGRADRTLGRLAEQVGRFGPADT